MEIPWQARASLFWLILAFIFMVVSHLSPYWYMEEPYTHIGLWEKCEWRQPCVWSHENYFYWEIIQPEWWKVCQVLYSLGLFTMFVNLILTIEVNVSSDLSSDIKNIPKVVNMVFMVFALIEILATLALFGRMAHAERGVMIDDEEYRNFGWAYLLGCIAELLLLIALIFFVLYYRKDRMKRKEAPQFQPIMFQQAQVMGPPPGQFQHEFQGPPPGQQHFQFPPPGQYQQQFQGPPPGQFHLRPMRQQAPQQQQYMTEKQALNYA